MTATQTTALAPAHDLMTVRDVAKYLRVSPRTVYRLIREGQLKSIRIGKQIRVSRDALPSAR